MNAVMTCRAIRLAWASLFGCFVAAAALAPPALAAEQRPNFVVVLGDNLGRDWFGCYGGDGGNTPNIDKLAQTGTRFEHCYVTALCSTTRAMLWSGRYGYRTGWSTHHDAAIYGGGGFDWRSEITLARVMQSAGYATALSGKWQINDLYDETDALTRHGFDEHLVWTGALLGEGTAEPRWKASLVGTREFESRYWDPVVFRNGERMELKGRFGPDVYLEFLVDFIERNREKPFFAFYSTPLTHVPTVTTPLSTSAEASEQDQFAGMVRYLDHQVGQLVAELDRLGLRDNTIVIVMTDNGTSPKHGNTVGGKRVAGGLGTLSENGIDVPLIVNCPGRVAEGRVSDSLTDCTDIFATVADLAGAKLPSELAIDGRSFAAELAGRPDPAARREWMYTQYASTRVINDGRFKLYSTGAIYDVTADPTEKTDLAASNDADVLAARKRLQTVLDRLPADTKLPFTPRSSSAFRLQRIAAESEPQGQGGG